MSVCFPFAEFDESIDEGPGDVMKNRVTSLRADGVRNVSARLYRMKNRSPVNSFPSLYILYIFIHLYIYRFSNRFVSTFSVSRPFFFHFLTEKPVQTKNRVIKKEKKPFLHVQPHICTTAAQQQACIRKSGYL